MRKKIIAANWKMHKTLSEAMEFIEEAVSKMPNTNVDAVVCASPLFLEELVKKTKNSAVYIGAQTMHFEEQGAYTGEVSPHALADLGVDYVIIGHSERREMFNETDFTVNKKVLAAFSQKLLPIICCGETLEQRESGETNQFVSRQIELALKNVSPSNVVDAVIAYEPIWAIGTGKSSTAEDANKVCGYIRSVIAKLYDNEVAKKVRIQYGGSVKPENISEYMAMSDIDGALVGGASLEVNSYLKLLEACCNG